MSDLCSETFTPRTPGCSPSPIRVTSAGKGRVLTLGGAGESCRQTAFSVGKHRRVKLPIHGGTCGQPGAASVPEWVLASPAYDEAVMQIGFLQGLYEFSGLSPQEAEDAATLAASFLSGSYDAPGIEFEYSACKDEFSCTFGVPDGEIYVLQISDSSEGPWHPHIYAEGDETGTRTLRLNNDYQGQAWFRVVTLLGGIVRSEGQADASDIVPPEVEVSDIDVSSHALPQEGDFTLPYSVAENAWVSGSDLYVVPRARLQHTRQRFEYDGIPQIVTVTGDEEAVHKWTRDGSDPTADTVIKKLDGAENNLAVTRADFGLILKARSYKGACQSPLTVYLVDTEITGAENWFTDFGFAESTVGSCDFPHPESGWESGASCNVNWGSPEDYEDFMTSFTIGAAIAGDLAHSRTQIYLYQQTTGTVNRWYGGFIGHRVSTAYFAHSECTLYRYPPFWDAFRPSWLFGEVQISDGTGTPVTTVATWNNDGGSMSGAGVTSENLADSLASWISDYLVTTLQPDPEAQLDLHLTKLNFRLTLHHDILEDPPEVDPFEPEEPYVPSVPIFGDDFEEYVDEPDLTAVTLDGGTGWDDAWSVINYVPEAGQDFFEEYSDGVLLDTDELDLSDPEVQDLRQGEGWEGEWILQSYSENREGEDDFQSYVDGELSPFDELLGGVGWAPESSWNAFDLSPGHETWESYSDGVVTTASNLLGGTGWILDPWQIHDYA